MRQRRENVSGTRLLQKGRNEEEQNVWKQRMDDVRIK
jgi:hypothetical protein